MRINFAIYIVLFFAFAKIGTAQTTAFTEEDVAGIYVYDHGNKLFDDGNGGKTKINYKVTLSPDGTFEYHNFRQLENQPKEHWYGKGTWTFKGKTVYFTATAADIDEKYMLDFNNSKARFFKKSVRSKSAKEQPTYIQFFASEYKVAIGKKLFKTNE